MTSAMIAGLFLSPDVRPVDRLGAVMAGRGVRRPRHGLGRGVLAAVGGSGLAVSRRGRACPVAAGVPC